MDEPSPAKVRQYQERLAPGTGLREGLDRIVHGRTGALVVLGNTKALAPLLTGGFHIDVEFSATALRELAKMDGAIVLNDDLDRIMWAGVHLMPDSSIPTVETGTRHRSADRTARQTGLPCVTVSASMSTIALYYRGLRLAIERPEPLLARANQALQTLERYKARLIEATRHLSSMEVQDSATQRDLVLVVQRHEMLQRLAAEARGYVVSLGTEGRLVSLQLAEAVAGLEELPGLLAQDYGDYGAEETGLDFAGVASVPQEGLVDMAAVARSIGFTTYSPDEHLTPRGYRQLAGIHRLPASVAARLIEHFGGLQLLFGASTADLQAVEGVGEARARMIRDGLIRLAEAAYDADRFG